MRINNNLMAMNTHRQLGINSSNGAKSIEKLSSGLRINRAGDDAAGLAISEKMRGQIRGLGQASRNAQDSISLVQTAEGALNETQAILQRMRELAVQSSNDTNVDADRSAIQNEVDQLATEITRISSNTEFNERTLLDGGLQSGNNGKLTFHIGANSAQNVKLGIGAMDAKTLNVSRDVTTGTIDSGNAAGVTSVKTDALDVANVLADADYQVIVSGTAAGVAATPTGLTAGEVSGMTSGVPTADFSVTFTKVANAGAVSSVAVSGISISGDASGADLNGVKLIINSGGATNAAWDSGTNTITLTLTNADLTSASGDALISGLGTVTLSGGGTLDLTATTVTVGAGISGGDITSDSGLFAGGTAVIADGWAVSSGSGATFAANYQDGAGAFTINGTSIDLAGIGVETTGESVRLVGNAVADVDVFLADNSGTAIGSGVTVDAVAGGSYTVGDTTTGQMEVTFAANAATVGTSTITVASATSDAASFSGGVTTAATVQGGVNVSTQTAADTAITTLNDALSSVSTERAKLGAVQNRLEHTIKNLDTSAENLQASESRIRDVDMAKEMMEFTKNNILSQAAQSMLAQANQAPQGVLQLLR